MNKQIILNDEFFLAKGGERDCYIHPLDKSKVIKIVHRPGKHNEQNKLEFKYTKYLKDKKIPFKHLTNCYGFINTTKGLGLVFDRVLDYSNSPSLPLKYYLDKEEFQFIKFDNLIEELKSYLFKYDILFIDVDLSNVFCQEFAKGHYRLIIVDGIGARRLNWRFYGYLKFKSFTRYKLKKQWKKFHSNYTGYRKKVLDAKQ